MKWITRERPKIDRLACPWLIKRFIDKKAEIIYVPEDKVISLAKRMKATPFDVPDVEFTHSGNQCTFDYFIQKYQITDPAIHAMALVIRGADTDRHNIAPQSSGLWAISAGLSYNIKDDQLLLEQGMILYDALYSWAKYLQKEKHTQNTSEKLLLDIYHKFLRHKAARGKKNPPWVSELKAMIQDHIDADLNISLTQVSKGLSMNPSYLSRKFSKYFNNLSYGEYLRKMRIEKAVQLIESSKYSLTEIAYLAGFSDQSHFTRVFKKHAGMSPLQFKKSLRKGKTDTKS